MTTVTTEEAAENFQSLLGRAEMGETIVIERAGRPVVQLRPATPNSAEKATVVNGSRVLGSLAGTMKVPDDFDEMMRAEIEEMFYGKP